jgi:hypothetical protein
MSSLVAIILLVVFVALVVAVVTTFSPACRVR